MLKYAGLLLILGLAVGLWLGFNPQAHKQTLQTWDQTKAAFLQIKTETTAKLHDWNSHTASWLKSSPKAETKPQAKPSSPSSAWKQITTAFEAFWNSMQRIWTNITAKLGSTKF